MSTVEESVEVSVPVQTAYNQWTQFESFPKFMRGVESIIQIDDTHNHWVTDLAGVRREFDTEITEQRPDERIAWHTVDGDTHHAGVVTFHRLDDQRSKVMIQLDWEPSGTAEKAASAVGVEDRQIRLDAERFKQFIESRKTETGAWPSPIPTTRSIITLVRHIQPGSGTTVAVYSRMAHTPSGPARSRRWARSYEVGRSLFVDLI